MENKHSFLGCYAQHPLVVFASGALLALGFAPFHLWLVLLVCVPVLYYALSQAGSIRKAVLLGFLFGYGFSIAGTYWIAYSLLVDAEKFAWLVPFSVLGLSAVMALWWGVFAAAYYRLRARIFSADAAMFVVLFLWVELAKSYGIFGFPWNLMGYVFADQLVLMQFASIAGVYGLSAVALIVGLLPMAWTKNRHAFFVGLVLVALVAGFGMNRLQKPIEYSDVTVRLVQPNIAQAEKWHPQFATDIMAKLRRLSLLPVEEGKAAPDMVIWPETALPFTIKDPSGWLRVSNYAVPKDSLLVTGMVRRPNGEARPRNSLMVVKNGVLRASYDKYQLVPFGEFIPFEAYLPVNKLTNGAQNFESGDIHTTLALEGNILLRPLVCYEAIFPDLPFSGDLRPQMLLNITNDAWFGNSPGPYQHAMMARLRAVEGGLPLVRVANTGISQLVGGYGRVHAQLPLGQEGVIDYRVPKALNDIVFSSESFAFWLFALTVTLLLIKNQPLRAIP